MRKSWYSQTGRAERRIAGGLFAGLVAVVFSGVLLAVPPAFASGGQLLLQVGGSSNRYSADPPPVFTGASILPGGSLVGEVAAQNASGVSGSLSLRTGAVQETGGRLGRSGSFGCATPGGLADQLVVAVWGTSGRSRSELFRGSVCALEAEPVTLAAAMQPGADVGFTVAAELPRGTGNDLMGASATWTFTWQLTASTGTVVGRVRLPARSSAGETGGSPPSHPEGVLAFTGLDLTTPVELGLAAILVGALGALVARSGRQRGGPSR